MDDFWSMGGYGPYIWAVYGLAAVFLIGFLLLSVSGLRAKKQRLKRFASRGRRRDTGH